LKASRNELITASHPSSSKAGLASASRSNTAARAKSSPPARASPMPPHTRITRRVTTGPATATRNSAPGESVSRLIFAMPPKNHRSMPAMWMPSRRAISACPSSWRISEAKNSIALATAVT
jgi:hypothetical protein